MDWCNSVLVMFGNLSVQGSLQGPVIGGSAYDCRYRLYIPKSPVRTLSIAQKGSAACKIFNPVLSHLFALSLPQERRIADTSDPRRFNSSRGGCEQFV